MAKPEEWTPFRALLWRIVEQDLYPITHDWSNAIGVGWGLLFRALENETWVARTAKPATYKFRKGRTRIPLGDNDIIHSHFWECFREAEEISSRSILFPRASGSWAERGHGDDGFMFYISNRIEGATGGAVESVEVRVDSGRMAKGRPGRKRGSSSLKERDREVVGRARAYISTTGASVYAAARVFAPDMPGGATLCTKIERLEDTLLNRRSLD